MQAPGKMPLKSRSGRLAKLIALAMIAAAFGGLAGCGRTYAPVGDGHGTGPGSNATLVAIKITPSTALLGLAGTRQLFAMGVYSDGTQFDVSASATWSASTVPAGNSTSPAPKVLTVSSTGVVSAVALGSGVVSATVGSVTGLLQLVVNATSYSSSTMAILPVPYKTTTVDAAYLPESQSLIQNAYAVQEINLDADQFSSVLPVPNALLASIPMPSGFKPSAAAASQSDLTVAVISYTSPEVVIIDASNDPTLDPLSNTVINTFTAPVSGTVTFNGNSCTICAAVVDPATDQLILSTAQGYYSMNLTTGAFTALPFISTGYPSPSFALNPTATVPYIMSATFGAFPSELQILNLPNSSGGCGTTADSYCGVTSYSNTALGVGAPIAPALDSSTNFAGILDVEAASGANNQTLLTLTDPYDLTITPYSPNLTTLPPNTSFTGLPPCSSESFHDPEGFNMFAIGDTPALEASNEVSYFYLTQTGPQPGGSTTSNPGNCVGFEIPIIGSVTSPFPTATPFEYGVMPDTPDGSAFVNSWDPNAIASFASVYDQKNYGVLISVGPQTSQSKVSQGWVAKLNAAQVFSAYNPGGLLPAGASLDNGHSITADTPSSGEPNVTYYPLPATAATLSVSYVNFGSPNVGTATPPQGVTLAYVGANPNNVLNISSIAIQGPNAADFFETDNCAGQLTSLSSCTINVSFTPSQAKNQEYATLVVTDDGGTAPFVLPASITVPSGSCSSALGTQDVCLTGIGVATTSGQ